MTPLEQRHRIEVLKRILQLSEAVKTASKWERPGAHIRLTAYVQGYSRVLEEMLLDLVSELPPPEVTRAREEITGDNAQKMENAAFWSHVSKVAP